MDLAANRAEVPAGAADRRGVDVGRVKFDASHRGRQSGTDSAGTTAKIDDDGARPGEAGRLLDKVLSAAPGDEDARVHRDVLAVELSPAQEIFKGLPRDPSFDQTLEPLWSVGRCYQEAGLVLGEDAAGSTEP
ncbi:hypothetical protein GCM10027405_01670 [Arthrobacter alkaliphilus]